MSNLKLSRLQSDLELSLVILRLFKKKLIKVNKNKYIKQQWLSNNKILKLINQLNLIKNLKT